MKNLDCSSVRTVRVHKEQFDAIENKADAVIITCIEDGRCLAFNRNVKRNTSFSNPYDDSNWDGE